MSRPSSFTLVKGFFGTVSVLAGIYIFFVLGPAVETRWFPVLNKMTILDVRPLTGSTSAVYTEFSKRRSCEYMGIAWYRGNEDKNFERVSMVSMRDPGDTSSPSRPVGSQRAGPWRIAMPAEEVRENSFVQVFHRCHPLWTTMTRFYP